MSLQDTSARYGAVTRALHWGMAAIFAWQFMGMILKIVADDSPVANFMGGTHASLGSVLCLLVAVRLLWAFTNRGARPRHGDGLLGRAALLGHAALYALMVIVPILALLRSYGSGRGLNFFGLFQLIPSTGTRVEWMVAPANALHGPLAWALLALIAGHIIMVFVHRGLLRYDVLAKMAG